MAPEAIPCPLCGKPAVARTFILAGAIARLLECPCVPVDRSPVTVVQARGTGEPWLWRPAAR